uniref:uncharacterized protein LOC123460275 n=1 Tax=Jaculus jaculus TaxID=51337 RepID=UPI001E1B36A6|nr:uncharacterized protein LOC123460275 [Jaculus jaculus]
MALPPALAHIPGSGGPPLLGGVAGPGRPWVSDQRGQVDDPAFYHLGAQGGQHAARMARPGFEVVGQRLGWVEVSKLFLQIFQNAVGYGRKLERFPPLPQPPPPPPGADAKSHRSAAQAGTAQQGGSAKTRPQRLPGLAAPQDKNNMLLAYPDGNESQDVSITQLCNLTQHQSLQILGWPRTLGDTPTSASRVLGLKACATTPGSNDNSYYTRIKDVWLVNCPSVETPLQPPLDEGCRTGLPFQKLLLPLPQRKSSWKRRTAATHAI